MTYASCPAWEFAADTHLLKFQCLQKKVFHTTGKCLRHTMVCELHMALQVPYIYNCAGNKQRSYKIMKMQKFVMLEKAKPDKENIRGLNSVMVECTSVQVTGQLF
jgi:hypothetical protein